MSDAEATPPPNLEHGDTVQALGQARDELASLPAVAGYIDRDAVLAILRSRMDLLTWGAATDGEAR